LPLARDPGHIITQEAGEFIVNSTAKPLLGRNPMDEPNVESRKAARVRLSRAPSYLQNAVPTRAIRSFENLVALANDQERFRDARKMVWRDRGEPAAELITLRQCLEHALRGGLREYIHISDC
jgi:Tfp pilus assembly protein PilF